MRLLLVLARNLGLSRTSCTRFVGPRRSQAQSFLGASVLQDRPKQRWVRQGHGHASAKRCEMPHARRARALSTVGPWTVSLGLVKGLPLFPHVLGQIVDKNAVVSTIEAVAMKLNLPLTSDLGQRLYGGHSLRVGGAQHLAAVGVPLLTIQLLAR